MSGPTRQTIFTHKPTLLGQGFLLRPFTEADIGAMGPILADPEVLRLTGSVHSTAELEAATGVLDDETLDWYRTRADQPDRMDLAVVDAATGACLGEIVLNDWEPRNQACGLRILLGPGGRDRGLGTASVRLLLEYVFTQTDLFRIGLEVHAFNPRALRAYEKAGFVVEGRRLAAHVFDGVRSDVITMCVLLRDWMDADAT
ncbi:GNAT family N-acetyltransferase [Arthrobacter sp. KK5.5]|uniref:GNAT family N-acetyltransferase n=1 Tax=Arthrobacter sp. KK5.5 TaxID=3373084 RepID=UPI003EE432AC